MVVKAEDVFTSLALPLMKLVGLKTVEMAEEGRFSTIITDTNRSHSQVFSLFFLIKCSDFFCICSFVLYVSLKFYFSIRNSELCSWQILCGVENASF